MEARAEVFDKGADYRAFLDATGEVELRPRTRLLVYCLMPSHFHLVPWPHHDGDLGRWTHWLLTTHDRSHFGHYRHSGPIWQGRFKVFPIQDDDHLVTIMR